MNQLTEHPIDTPVAKEIPTPSYPEQLLFWHELAREYPYLRVIADHYGNEPAPPPKLPREQFLCLLGSLYDPAHRVVIRDMLLDLLGDGIADICRAISGEEEA